MEILVGLLIAVVAYFFRENLILRRSVKRSNGLTTELNEIRDRVYATDLKDLVQSAPVPPDSDSKSGE